MLLVWTEFQISRVLDANFRVFSSSGDNWGSASESPIGVLLGDTVVSGAEAGRGVDPKEKGEVAVSASPTGKFDVCVPSPSKGMLQLGFLRPVPSSPPEEDVVLVLGFAESSSKGIEFICF